MTTGKLLSIICCYQVCNHTIQNAGPKTAFSQQWSLLRDQGQLSPNPRRQFIHDLDRLLLSLTTSGNSIILAGDFNEVLDDTRDGLLRLATKYSLRDSIAHRHGDYQCTTYNRGTKCIDYILVSHNITNAITQSGIPTFNTIIPSDHRPIFIDLDPSLALGNNISSLLTPSSRALFSSSPSRRDKYITFLYQHLEHHRLIDRVHQLSSLHPIQDRDSGIQLAESIDRDMTRLMIAVEKTLTKPSPTPFSSKLAQACIRVSILKLRLQEIQFRRTYSIRIERLQTSLLEPFSIPSTCHTVKTMLRTSRQHVRQLRKDARSLCEEFLLSKETNCDNPTIIKRIRRAEELKQAYLKLRYILQPSTHTLVTQLDVPSDQTPPKQATIWTRITDPDEVTKQLIHRNTVHFGAAHGTPFTVPPLSRDFDRSAQS